MKIKKIVAAALLITMSASLFTSCAQEDGASLFEPLQIEESFASYNLEKLKVEAKVPAYEVKPDLSNVVGAQRYSISDEVKAKLAENAFVVLNSDYNDLEFFGIYEDNRYNMIPNFVTVDSLLHSFHLQFDYILKTAEIKKLNDELIKMTENMLADSIKDVEFFKGTEWEEATIKNAAFFGVAQEILGKNAKVEGEIKDLVELELDLIEQKEPMQVSPVMSLGDEDPQYEDYTQYQVRGHYTDKKVPELQKYFKAMMWYGRMPFLFKSEVSMRSAALIAKNLSKAETAPYWIDIYETTAFFAGDADSVTPIEASLALQEAYSGDVTIDGFLEKKAAFKSFVKQLKKLDRSRIETNPHMLKENKEANKAESAGLKFMGQRYSIDADIFQNLIFSKVEMNSENEYRMLPKFLDVPAAFGSDLAKDILKEEGDFNFENYEENLNKMQEEVKKIPDKKWNSNLYWAWLYNLYPLINEHGNGYPTFMKNREWSLKNLNTFAGSYTELKHDTILYSASVMAEKGGAFIPDFDDRGYVEPEPEIYARMASLSQMMIDGLEKRGLLNKKAKNHLKVLNEMASRFQKISIMELRNRPLSDEDYEFIREYGGNLEHLWFNRFAEDEYMMVDQDPAMVIADVASDPDGNFLELGVGEVRKILVVFPREGELHLGVGAVFSTHEFKASGERYTDEMWREEFRQPRERKPKERSWTKGYTVNTSYEDYTDFNIIYSEEE